MNRRDPSEPNGNIWYQVFKVGFKGRSNMYAYFQVIFNPKIKQKIIFCVYLIHLSIFNRCSKFIFEKCIHNTFQIRGDRTQRQQNSSKNKVKFVDCHMKWIVLSYLGSYFEETKYILVYFTNVPAFKNTLNE